MKFKMYFMPILVAVLSLLLVPSPLLAVGLGLLVAAYLRFGGERVEPVTMKLLRGQIAYRLLSVKLLALNGPTDEDTYRVHGLLTPDQPENAELRGLLRDAAALTGAGWKGQARIVRAVYGKEPAEIVDRYEKLLLQFRAQPVPVSADTEARMVELGKIWKIGPDKARHLFAKNGIEMSPVMLAWA